MDKWSLQNAITHILLFLQIKTLSLSKLNLTTIVGKHITKFNNFFSGHIYNHIC